MKKLTDGLVALTVEDERKEIMTVLTAIKPIVLKREPLQKNYKLVNDIPVCVGFMEMFTIVSDFIDANGYNRKGSTFAKESLAGIGIDFNHCEVIG